MSGRSRSINTICVAMSVMLMLAPSSLVGQSDATPQASDLTKQIAELKAMIQRLQNRANELEAKVSAMPPQQKPVVQAAEQVAPTPAGQTAAAPEPASNLLSGTSVNFMVDGYYQHGFNNPIGRVNLLRAYDVIDAFALNQAVVVFENAPDPEHGKRYGLRLDLQFGQATATLQGNAANEPRPEVYRNIFQAYGTYVIPVGSGLTADFGKWASSLGIESNYTQSQLNYSRSYWFNFLPFYHTGVRMNYQLNKAVGLNYWITNGTQQTEPFNGFRDQCFGLNLQPTKNLSWNINYYVGQEHPDIVFLPGSTNPSLPSDQGLPFAPIPGAPEGKLHVFDSYATWNVSPKLTLALEADYVLQRLYENSPPSHASGGAGYARYQLSPRVAVASRFEYLSDRGGLFSGKTQALKETTFTIEQKIAEGLIMRQEWRRDFSNQPYFLTDTLGILKREQDTATMGIVWWFGPKKAPW